MTVGGAGSARGTRRGRLVYDWGMTTRASYHVETANEFQAKAHAYLREGDLLQASEKGWGATARMVKAAAETRGWRHSSHGDLYRAVNRLARELGDGRIRILFRSASALHQNFYEGYMPEETVADSLKDVEEITGLLAAFVD